MSAARAARRTRPAPRDPGLWRRFINIYRSIRIPWMLLLAGFALGILAAQVVLWIAPLTAQINRGDFTTTTLVPAFIGLTAASIVVSLTRNLASLYAQNKITRRLQTVVWTKLLRAPMSIIDRENAPELVSRVTNDPLRADSAVLAFVSVWASLWGFGGALIAMGQANGTLSLIFLLIVPITVATFWVVGVTQFVAERMIMRAWGTMTGFFAERLGLFIPLKALGAERAELAAGEKAIDKMFRAGVVQELFSSVQTLMGSVVTNSAIVIVFAGGAAFIRSGDMSQTDLTLYHALVLAALPFLFEILTQYQTVKGTQGFTEKIGKVLELPEEDSATGAPIPAEPADIRLDGVTFAYGGRVALKDVSLTIPGGRVTAIVGPNGSGKSTLLKLLQRAYEPTSGSILLADRPSTDFALDAWRRAVSTVAQNTSLLSGTVRENIAFANLDAPFSRVEWAAGVADARGFIESAPQGYELPVGEGGEKLSGGQRQRVTIARALVPEPTCLLLDEVGSALDRRTDAKVDAALRTAMTGRTVVIVSHRLESITDADQVIVMRDGGVEATGRHEDLLASCTTYRQLLGADRAAASGTAPSSVTHV